MSGILPSPIYTPTVGSPKTWEPRDGRLAAMEKHRLIVRGGEVRVYLHPVEDSANPISIDPWTTPEFKTLICSGIIKMVFEWVSGTPTISCCSYS